MRILCFVFFGITLASVGHSAPNSLADREPAWGGQSIKPILAAKSALDPRKVALGKALFAEKNLSRDNTISCATCHDLQHGGADGRVHPIGIDGAEGEINTPTVFNSGLNFKQFWDGRANTLEEQVDFPLQSAREMGSNWPDVLRKLNANPTYVAEFRRIYPDGLRPENVRNAIAEFERSLLTPNAPFDRFLQGDKEAITPLQKEGYRKFKLYGCASCHQGTNVGGNIFQAFGTMADYFADRGHVTTADYGRFNVTGREEDRFVFKVPSLRNVALTAPYFHDGSAATLEEAIAVIAKYQLDRALSAEDVQQIAAFLQSLTGEYTP